MGYVPPGGANALGQIDRELLTRPDRLLELKTTTANALKFLVANETNIARPRLLLSCRLLLREPETAKLIVRDLAQWEKWRWKRE